MAYTTIDDPEAYFQVKAYTGTGSTLSVTLDGDTDMQPDMVWLKCRSLVKNHYLFDAVRGATEHINPNDTDVEGTDANTLTAFGSDGFTVGSSGAVNTSSATFVAWCWKAGTTSGITTDGNTTITPSAYSFNQDAGISILRHTGNSTSGAKMAHGLGAVPHMTLVKNTQTGNEWVMYHHKNTAAPETDGLVLNTNAATADDASYWNDTAPDSVNTTFGNSGATNDSTGGANVYISFSFTAKQGYSKFGSYIGNGDNDGAFVYTGFRPAMVIYKKSSGTENWFIHDNRRQGFNPDNEYLFPDLNNAEGTVNRIDLLSNGFKARTSDGGINGDGATYIYMAFAHSPFVNSEGVPTNAR